MFVALSFMVYYHHDLGRHAQSMLFPIEGEDKGLLLMDP